LCFDVIPDLKVNLSFDIVLHEEGRKGSLYSIRFFEDEDRTELEFFLTDSECRKNLDFKSLKKRLRKEGPYKRGWRDNWFRSERGVEAIWAPYPENEPWTPTSPVLRLYCVRFEDALIVGGGGVKTTRTFQEDAGNLEQFVDEMEYVDERLQKRKRAGDVQVKDGHLVEGNLTFHKDDIL
jgi:hypothetical protein